MFRYLSISIIHMFHYLVYHCPHTFCIIMVCYHTMLVSFYVLHTNLNTNTNRSNIYHFHLYETMSSTNTSVTTLINNVSKVCFPSLIHLSCQSLHLTPICYFFIAVQCQPERKQSQCCEGSLKMHPWSS